MEVILAAVACNPFLHRRHLGISLSKTTVINGTIATDDPWRKRWRKVAAPCIAGLAILSTDPDPEQIPFELSPFRRGETIAVTSWA